MNRIFIAVIFFIFCGNLFGQNSRIFSLIVSECKQVFPDSVCYPISREYVKYKFQNGALLGREILIENDENPFEFFLSDENNHIYQNKFLISQNGDVYDFEKKKVVFKSNFGALRSQEGDRIIRNLGLVAVLGNRVYTRLSLTNSQVTEREALFYFDLKTNEYKIIREVKDFPEITQSNFSPNNKLLAVYEKSKLVFYRVDAKFNFIKIREVNLLPVSKIKKTENSDEPDPTEYSIAWIDNQNILTVNKKNEIIKVNLTGKIFSVIKPKKNEANGILPEISKDRFGNFYVYPCEKYPTKEGETQTCRLNLIAKTLKYDDIPIGNNFDQLNNRNTAGGEYTYKGVKIGNPIEIISNKDVIIKNQGEKTIDGYIAAAYSEKYNKIAYFKVWNDIKNDWIKLQLKWHPENFLIGWIEEQ